MPTLQARRKRRTQGETPMGRFAVRIEVANNDDMADARRGHIKLETVRRVTLEGVVDSGATRLVLPGKVIEQLGLPLGEKVKVIYADKRPGFRHKVSNVWLKMNGRDGVFDALVEPKRNTALIGAIVLETLDYVVDCISQKVVPRNPNYLTSEIE